MMARLHRNKSKIKVRKGKKEEVRGYTPKLQDFKKEDDSNIEKRGMQSQRALQARRMDTFRSEIEEEHACFKCYRRNKRSDRS